MRIVVCLRRVPDTEAQIRIGEDGRTLDPAGVRFILNPYDEFALEAALRTPEGGAEGEVVVVALGEAATQETLRGALALGADRAFFLQGEPTWDGRTAAAALLPLLSELAPDLLLIGRRAVDEDQEQLGPLLADGLKFPCATSVSDLEVGVGEVTVLREGDGGRDRIRLPLPALLTVTKGAFELRHPSVKGIMAAKKKPLLTREATGAPTRVHLVELALPPERVGGQYIGEGSDAAAELVRRLRDEAKAL